MDLGKELINALSHKALFTLNLFGIRIEITDVVVVTWIIMAILAIASFFLTRNFKPIPEGRQNFIETIVEKINSFAESNMEDHWRITAPYLGTVLIFLIVANGVSLFNIFPTSEDLYRLTGIEFFKSIPSFSIRPPTRDINVTAGIAVMSMVAVAVTGLRVRKFKGWLKSFIEPMPLILPFKILDYFIRPLSLCLRLFGNILGAVLVMELAYFALPLLLPAALSIYFDLFDGIIQAYILVFLTSLYMREALE